MNYFKEAEYILQNYPKLKTALQNLKRRQGQLIAISTPSYKMSAETSRIGAGSAYVSNTINDLEELSYIAKEINAITWKIQEIENILSDIEDDKRKIIEMIYFQNLTHEKAMKDIYLSGKASFYRKKKKAIEEFSILYFGISALDYIIKTRKK
ncbi:MAG: hypothetical protein FWD48_01105 [Oscillospiraceae bacterium]|nr:hypothetical protein [Oscillospiraceae bacterium]